jgi:pyrimidine deaminase RibD-like protein
MIDSDSRDCHHFYMRRCLALAARGLGMTSPNPPVGSLIVKNSKILGQGWHTRAGGKHAEVAAIENVSGSVEGATLYVTLEPCNHFGRTPPCTEKIIESGIKKVVFSLHDPNQEVSGGGGEYLIEKGIEVRSGVLVEHVANLMAPWIFACGSELPYVSALVFLGVDSHFSERQRILERNIILKSRFQKYLRIIDKFIDCGSAQSEELSESKLRQLRSQGVIHLGVCLGPGSEEIWKKGLFNELVVCRALKTESNLGEFAELGKPGAAGSFELKRLRKFGNDTVSVYGLA